MHIDLSGVHRSRLTRGTMLRWFWSVTRRTWSTRGLCQQNEDDDLLTSSVLNIIVSITAAAAAATTTTTTTTTRDSGSMVVGQVGQQIFVGHGSPVTVDPFYTILIRHPTWCSGSWKNQQRQSKQLFWLLTTFHNLCNSLAKDEQATSETHRFPRKGPNSVEILGKKD